MPGKNCNFLQCLENSDRQLLRRFVISLVLHTDMAKHNDLVVKLKRTITTKKETGTSWLDQKDDTKAVLEEAQFLLDMMLHCADLGNVCRPTSVMKEWCKRVITEFWRQGDLERIHGLPVGPGRDRSTANVPLGQQFFIKVLVSPLYTLWNEVVPETEICLKYLHANLEYWKKESELKKKKEREKKKQQQPPSSSLKSPKNDAKTTRLSSASSEPTITGRKCNPNKRREYHPPDYVAETF